MNLYGQAVFCGHSILTEDVFVTKLSNNVELSHFIPSKKNCDLYF